MVQFLPIHEHLHARGALTLFLIVEIACSHEEVEGTDNGNRETMEAQAKLVEIEFIPHIEAIAHRQLEEISQLVIHFPHIVFLGKCLGHAPREFAMVGIVI